MDVGSPKTNAALLATPAAVRIVVGSRSNGPRLRNLRIRSQGFDVGLPTVTIMFFNRLETPGYPEAGAGALVVAGGFVCPGTALERFHVELWSGANECST